MESGTAEDLIFVGGPSSRDAFAVSNWGTIFSFDGTTWRHYHDGPFGVLNLYYSIYTVPIERYASPVGGDSKDAVCLKFRHPFDNSQSGYYRFDGHSWAPVDGCDGLREAETVDLEEIRLQNRLNGIWASAADNIISVGGGGQILHYDGLAWRPMQSPAETDLNAVHGSARDHVIAVGEGGTVIRFDGQAWVALESGLDADLNAVYVTPGLSVITGDDGTLVQYKDGQFTPVDVGAFDVSAVGDVWGSGPDDIYVLTSQQATMLHFDGLSWEAITPELEVDYVTQNIGIWGRARDDIYLVSGHWYGSAFGGSDFFLHRYDGQSWRRISLPQIDALSGVNAVWGDPAGNLFLSVKKGLLSETYPALMAFDGSAFSTIASVPGNYPLQPDNPALTDTMRAIWGVGDGDLFFAGDNGTILRWQRPDVTPPEVLATDPASAADAVDPIYDGDCPLIIRILFSESIDPATITEQTITVIDGSGSEVARQLIVDGNEVTINCQSSGGFGETLTARVSSEVKDLAGNRLGEVVEWSFKMRHATPIDSADLFVGTRIYTSDEGIIEGTWRQGGQDLTSRGDRVVWGYFYADPERVSWGSPENPDLFVKIWFDVGGDVYVSYLHQSVPQMLVHSGLPLPADGNISTLFGVASLSERYIGHYYFSETHTASADLQSDCGDPAVGLPASGNPAGFVIKNRLRIGAVIQTEDKGPIEAIWQQGGEDATERGDDVVWGYFYADPEIVSWGSPQNPDIFVKIWFDRSGSVFINYFHASVPDIEVYTDYTNDGIYDQKGATTNYDRYIRHSAEP